jgi:5-methylthioadenosine/S-adenosylhomocysteine deaminase
MLRSFSLFLLLAFRVCAAEPVDLIVSARYVVTVDPQYRILDNAAVAVRGNSIVAIGPATQIQRDYTSAHIVARPQAILMPGLVSTHTHAAMSLLRGIADDLALQDWLEHHIFPAEAKNVTPDFVLWGTRLACLEMMLGGTTTFTDMYYFEDTASRAVKEAGMRGVMGETIIKFPVADAKTPKDALAYTERFLKEFAGDELVTAAVAPHAIYTNDDATLKAARALANKYNAPLLIHVAETEKELIDTKAERHATPVEALDRLGVFNGRTVAAHCVWLEPQDFEILSRDHVGVAHCPSSNMKLASGAAKVVEMIAHGIHVGLGPDGPAGSNNDLDLMEEMDLAGKLQKLITRDPRALPARQIVEAATIGGARVLGLDSKIGSLEPGKRADMITISLNEANAVPLYDVTSQLVYALKASDVQDVWVNGKQLVDTRRPLTLNSSEIYAHARTLAARVKMN